MNWVVEPGSFQVFIESSLVDVRLKKEFEIVDKKYIELKYTPVVGIGHSAAASWPYYFGAWNPERTLACISVSGQ